MLGRIEYEDKNVIINIVYNTSKTIDAYFLIGNCGMKRNAQSVLPFFGE